MDKGMQFTKSEKPLSFTVETPDALFIDPPKHKFRCPKGHLWEGSPFNVRYIAAGADRSKDYHTLPLCPYCYVDWHAQMFPAEEIKDA